MTRPACIACGFNTDGAIPGYSAEWYREHKAHHLQAFPNLDIPSRLNLDDLVRWAEMKGGDEGGSDAQNPR